MAFHSDQKDPATASVPEYTTSGDEEISKGELINASGHVQELDRQFNIVSLAGAGLVTGNVWPALGGSILVAIFNGGPPGSFTLSIKDRTHTLTEA